MTEMLKENEEKAKENTTSPPPVSKTESKMSWLLKRVPELGEVINLERQIGAGTFSQVYLGKEKNEAGRALAIKHLVPTVHPKRASAELAAMHQLGGVDNIAEVLMCLRKYDCIVFVMPYLEHDKFSTYVGDMSIEETKDYMRNLLIALKRVHSFGIIHRDVKPSNFLYNRKQKKYLLVDFGLSQKVEEYLSGENIKIKFGDLGKKRKREDEENSGSMDCHHETKRQALGFGSGKETSRTPLGQVNRPQVTFATPQAVGNRIGGSSRVDTLFAKPESVPKVSSRGRCGCEGRLKVCENCLGRPSLNAPRAGTPGFRPPEVLLKINHQTTAVDIWAVGVILLSIMSATYPFFRSPDDMTALAEIISIFGTRPIKDLALKLGRNIVCSEEVCEVDFKRLVGGLRQGRKREERSVNGEEKEKLKQRCSKCNSKEGFCKAAGWKSSPPQTPFPDEAFDLLSGLLNLDPFQRLTAQQALDHPFLRKN